MRAVLRIPAFRLLFTGLAASMVGDALLILVFAIWVKTLTGSNGAAGLVTLFVAAPYVLAPLGGWLVDRFRHRPFLVVANLASALTLLPLFAVQDAADVWIIYAVAALYGISSVTIAAALSGLVKELLAEDLLADANGTLQTVKEGLRLGGPLAGAALFATLGGAAVAAIDAATFVVAAVVIARIPLREDPPVRSGLRGLSELTAGVTHLRTDPALRRMTIAMAIGFLVSGITESAVFAVIDQGLHRPPAFVGVLTSAQGLGAIAGGLRVARLIARVGELTAITIGLAAVGLGNGLYALPSLPVILIGLVITGLGQATMVVGFATVIQRRTPGPLIGRVSTATEMLVTGPQTVSIAAGAALISVVDYRLLLMVDTAGMVTAAACLWPARRLTAPVPPADRPVEVGR
ncbi:MFS transporter [Actinoallomurus rhizosphaericola]|uniref:MFS transporter n=1 Tax=Actinoallomurus rhizosphaericola TaxID=2952536 RepID=UPI0020930975|nr:MFS transporter [Actinoallomurus rhizosphaericola]MCO5997452.1 MFS transporter [Actinoallomurus rhizosphaericola]